MMFSTITVGKKISALRKEHNMTQMELADLMSVSYQAVSNWERGNSMPDISKLPELAGIFGVTIDELLGGASPLIKSAADNKMESYLEENKVTVEELTEAAPILKPNQVDAAAESMQVDNLKELASVAPFISGEKIAQMVNEVVWATTKQLSGLPEKIAASVNEHIKIRGHKPAGTKAKSDNLDGIEKLASFMSEEALAQIARQLIEEGRSIDNIAMHMNEGDVGTCARMLAEKGGDIGDLLPYMNEDDVGACAAMYVAQERDIEDMLPFMNDDDISKCARSMYELKGIAAITDWAPFIDEDTLREIAEKAAGKGGDIEKLLPYMNEDDVGACAAMYVAQERDIEDMLPFMNDDDISKCARSMYELKGIAAIAEWAPFIDEDTLREIAEDVVKKQGYQAILPLAPYL